MKNQENINEENLRDILNGNENSFNVPKDYFENLPDEIMKRVNELPDFEKTSNENPFEVPANYFENLPNIVSEKITSRKKSSSIVIRILRPAVLVPLSFAAIITIFFIYLSSVKNISTPSEKEFTADDLKNSTYFQSIDEDLLVEMLPMEYTIASEDSLEQYLIDNNIDISQLENEL
jgi:hypothetical protein